jgi:hypothetical protein
LSNDKEALTQTIGGRNTATVQIFGNRGATFPGYATFNSRASTFITLTTESGNSTFTKNPLRANGDGTFTDPKGELLNGADKSSRIPLDFYGTNIASIYAPTFIV